MFELIFTLSIIPDEIKLLIVLVIFTILLIFAVITASIAGHNERDKTFAFMAGFFLGPLGVAMYAIMGESVELRVALEEKERRRLKLEREKEERARISLFQNTQDS